MQEVTAGAATAPIEFTQLTAAILATGAVGTAAFGIVEALKFTPLGLAGYRRIPSTLGAPLMDAVGKAYGSGTRELLHGLYRQDRKSGKLAKTLRQGVGIRYSW